MRDFFRKYLNPDTLPRIMFVFSLCLLFFGYGYLSLALGIFPHSLIRDAAGFISEQQKEPQLPWYYTSTGHTAAVPTYEIGKTADGLSLVTGVLANKKLAVSIINMEGDLIHRWHIDWFKMWPDQDHIPSSDPDFPQSPPGTHIHGALLLENGDLIFNFTNLGLVRLDICGNEIWKLPIRTHHSIYQDEYGDLWIPGLVRHEEPLQDLPNHLPRFTEFFVLKISTDGELLNQISLFEVMKRNDLLGLLNLASQQDHEVMVSGDTLHLNKVVTFPSELEEGVFQAGDIMVSLRNINTVMVFREQDLQVTQLSVGRYVRQHDPDFLDGNTISVYDNYNIAPADFGHHSRILLHSFDTDEVTVYYTGSDEQPFYSSVMGNHQWLPNGNLLITESTQGRAFEIDPEGKIVWEYINLVDEGLVGIVEDVQRLPALFSEDFFHQRTANCPAPAD